MCSLYNAKSLEENGVFVGTNNYYRNGALYIIYVHYVTHMKPYKLLRRKHYKSNLSNKYH